MKVTPKLLKQIKTLDKCNEKDYKTLNAKIEITQSLPCGREVCTRCGGC
jgi:hypothetical protein